MGIIEKMRLDNKVSYVTGGAKGIGKSVAIAFAQAGACVAIVDIDIEEAKKTAQMLNDDYNSDSIAIKADVTNENDVDNMINTIIDKYGKLDIAFNNAGICINEAAEDMSYSKWKKVIDINLSGIFLTSKAAGNVMIKQGGGSIINTASMSAHIVNVPQPQCAYNASKAGVIQLSKSLAIEWSKHKVRVNTISPGYMATELIKNSTQLKPLIEEWNNMAPMKRMGNPEELQSICVYLAGDTSSFTTGSDFVVDGAFTCF